MSFTRLLAFVFCFLAISGQAKAQEVVCNRDGSQREIDACVSDDLDKSDKRVEEAYIKELAILKDPSAKDRFKASQDAWNTFRKLNCDYVVGPQEGTAYGMFLGSCLRNMDEARTKEINDYLRCQNRGRGGCPQ